MRILLSVTLAGLLAACGPSEATPPTGGVNGPPPNILLISIDTLRADHLSCYGYGRETSPKIDALAAQGVLFENAHSSSSWTLPGLASLVTGQASSTHGCWTFAARLANEHETLAERLLAYGYDTASITTNLFTSSAYGLQQGFVLADDGVFRSDEGPLELAITSPRVSNSAIEYLEAKAEAEDGWPWFLWLHYFDPHDTYMEHEGFSERFGAPNSPGQAAPQEVDVDRDLYDGEILFTDYHIGRVLDSLDQLGLRENTITVLVADHGEEFMDHGRLHHGHTLYTELTHMPFLISGPGIAPRRIKDTASLMDVLPTLLDLVGADVPEDIGGRSLAPTLRGQEQRPHAALTEVRLHAHAVFEGLRLENWSMIRGRQESDVPMLFDIEQDPAELHDVAAQFPEVVERLGSILDGTVHIAEERSKQYGAKAGINLSTDQLEAIRGLGYMGDDR